MSGKKRLERFWEKEERKTDSEGRAEKEVRTESKAVRIQDNPHLLGGKFFALKHLFFSRFIPFVRCFGGRRPICSSLILGIGIRLYSGWSLDCLDWVIVLLCSIFIVLYWDWFELWFKPLDNFWKFFSPILNTSLLPLCLWNMDWWLLCMSFVFSLFSFTLFSFQLLVWSSRCPVFLVLYAMYANFSCSVRIIWVNLHTRII